MGKHRSDTATRERAGSEAERWLFDDMEPAWRCSWPTADCARGLMEGSGYGVRAVLDAYASLLDHPAGTESFVARLRDLRRAEREGGFGSTRPTSGET